MTARLSPSLSPSLCTALITLFAAASLLLFSHDKASADDAYTMELQAASYDEECLIYTLQGLVNRDAPRLFLDTNSVFWQAPASDKYWINYLHEKKGFNFLPLGGIRETIEHFRASVKGLALYDPARDASRYVALTLCAQKNLLPVTPDILAYRTPGMSAGLGWTEDTMQQPPLWHGAGARAEKSSDGLKITVVGPTPPYGAIDRPILLHRERTPVLELTVASCKGLWAAKIGEGGAADTELISENDRTGVIRQDLRGSVKTKDGRVTLRLFAIGTGSAVVISRVRLLDADGKPVTSADEKAPDCFNGLPIVEDLRGKWTDDLAAYRWAIDNLMPGCTHKLAFSGGHSHDDSWLGGDTAITIGLDYPIAQKAFCFNLSPVGKPWQHDGKQHPGYIEQAKLFDEIMSRLERPSGVFGWSEPEDQYCGRISADGNYVMCCGAPNISFWAKVPAAKPRIPVRTPASVALKPKYYVVFQTNEGDTPKILSGLMASAWINPSRGKAPIAWGIDPHIADFAPALIEFYATTATGQDSFFAGCSGAGYCYPWHMPNTADYAAHVGHCIQEYGPAVVDIWENAIQLDRYAKYNERVHASSFTQQTVGAARNVWLEDGTPVISADSRLYYYEPKGADPAGIVTNLIRDVAAVHGPPYFILCYGNVNPDFPSQVAEIQRRLPADQFEVIGIDQMSALAKEAGKLQFHVDSMGASPGTQVKAQITLCNPDGNAGEAGRVKLQMPIGWSSDPPVWEHGAIAKGESLHKQVVIHVGAAPADGSATITCGDMRWGAVRTAKLTVYTETKRLADFGSGDGWTAGSGATLTAKEGVVKLRTTTDYAPANHSVEIDFDRNPILEIGIPNIEGAWALKANDGTLAVDLIVQADTGQSGRFTYNLAQILHWTGKKRFNLVLFAIGAGKSVTVNDLVVHYGK